MYSLYPVMIGSTIAVVIFIIGVSFGSVLLPVRLLLTVAISLCWTYGLMVCSRNATQFSYSFLLYNDSSGTTLINISLLCNYTGPSVSTGSR